MILSRNTVHFCTQTHNAVSQRTIVHIETPFYLHTARIDIQGVSLLNVIVKKRTEQIVGRCNRMHISGKMQVNILHRNHLSIPAARSAALYTENRTKRRLPKRQNRFFPKLIHTLGKTYTGSCFSLSGRSGIYGCNKNQLAVGLIRKPLYASLGDLCLIVTVRLQLIFGYPQIRGNISDFFKLRPLRYFDICKHCFPPSA